MNYKGVIIEESLENKDVLKDVTVLGTKVEDVTEGHKTPWIKQWTLHTVEVVGDRERRLQKSLARPWIHSMLGTRISEVINLITLFFEARYSR